MGLVWKREGGGTAVYCWVDIWREGNSPWRDIDIIMIIPITINLLIINRSRFEKYQIEFFATNF